MFLKIYAFYNYDVGDIRKATPVIIFSLVLMLSADIVSIVGYVRKDYRTIVGAILSIVSGLRSLL